MTPWLKWLERKKQILHDCCIQSENLTQLHQIEQFYNPMGNIPNYALECSLLDHFSCDYSSAYCAEYMLKYESYFKSEELWYKLARYYAVNLKQQGETSLNNGTICLEIDSSKGRKDAAIFFDLHRTMDTFPLLMKKAGCADRLEFVESILSEVKSDGFLNHLGFMTTRNKAPVRLVINTPDASAVLKKIERLGVYISPELLSVADEFKNKFRFMVDLDILEGGVVGPMIGLELLMPRSLLLERKDDYDFLVKYLRKRNYMDERIEKLEKICGEETFFFDGACPASISLITKISHFKLRWDENRILPTKIYFHIVGTEACSDVV